MIKPNFVFIFLLSRRILKTLSTDEKYFEDITIILIKMIIIEQQNCFFSSANNVFNVPVQMYLCTYIYTYISIDNPAN